MYVLQHKAVAFELATFTLFLMDLVYPQKDLQALFSLTLGTHVIARDGFFKAGLKQPKLVQNLNSEMEA